jgi:hypothetical protein
MTLNYFFPQPLQPDLRNLIVCPGRHPAQPKPAPVRRHALTGECCPDASEVVVTVAHGMIFQDKLARQRRIAIERYGRGAIQFCIAKSTDRRSRRSAVGR